MLGKRLLPFFDIFFFSIVPCADATSTTRHLENRPKLGRDEKVYQLTPYSFYNDLVLVHTKAALVYIAPYAIYLFPFFDKTISGRIYLQKLMTKLYG